MAPCKGIRVPGEKDCANATNIIKPPPTLKIDVNKDVTKVKAAKKLINSMVIEECVLTIKELRLAHDKYRSADKYINFR